MSCLEFFEKQVKQQESIYLRATVSLFAESLAKRSFPSMEFGQMQIKGGTGDLAEATNDLILDKAWLVYSNLCKIGTELTIAKMKVSFV